MVARAAGRRARERGARGDHARGGRAARARGGAVAAPRPVFLHGSGGDHHAWAEQERRFERGAFLDLPGHPNGTAHAAVGEIAAALAPAVAAQEGVRVLVGHSLGGAVALELARTRPELAAGLVLVATGARLPVPDAVLALVRDDFAAARERLVALSFAGPPGRAGERLRRTIDACGPGVLAADYAACAGFDARGALRGVGVPALVVAAGEDALTPPWMAEELTRELPLAQMAVVPGAGHQVIVEGAGAVDLLIAAFLARLELTLDEG